MTVLSTKQLKNNLEIRLENQDLTLFEKISSQTTDNDKRSLLACQFAVRNLKPGYVYLEIGSYLGGSIQPHLIDDKCSKIISIDKRPAVQPDERGLDYYYRNNSTQRMLENLRQVSQTDLTKIDTIDGTSSQIPPQKIETKPHLCFIDGEHTDQATWEDFLFCLQVIQSDGAIIFHDSAIIYNALARIVGYLKVKNIKFNAYNLPDLVFVVEIGDFPLHQNSSIQKLLINNHLGYLSSLQFNDHYRKFANKPLFLWTRKFYSKIRGMGNTFD
jgi:hypothetical protein